MEKIKDNLETFFITWGVILVLNQVVLFGGCFNPVCLIAALPHTGFIAFLLSSFIIADEVKKNNQQSKQENKNESFIKYKEQDTSKLKTNSERMADDVQRLLKVPLIIYDDEEPSSLKLEPKSLEDIFDRTDVAVYDDKELSSLKLELKSLESKLQELILQKQEYLSDIDAFNREYNLHLGEIIKAILEIKREILYKKTIKQSKLKAKYKKSLKTFNETKKTIDELKNTIEELEDAIEAIDKEDENHEEIERAYKELQDELEKLENELEDQEIAIDETKEFIDESIEEEYEEVKSQYEEFEGEYERTKQSQKETIDLSDGEKAELKKLYNKAARLCHPDIVPDELKEKAHKIMQQFNAAYSKQDLKEVQKILDLLENGDGFELSSQSINDKETLKRRIQEYRQNIKDVENEIESIKQDDTCQTIAELDSWDAYFEELRSGLEEEKERLEKESSEVLGERDNKYNASERIKNNFMSNKFGGLLVDINNISGIEVYEQALYLITKYTNKILICKYDYLQEALEDKYVYQGVLNNPLCKVVLIDREYGLLKGYSADSDEYKELQYGHDLEYETIKATKPEQPKKEKVKKITKEDSPYAKHIQSIENIKFERIRKYCENLSEANEADEMQKQLGEQGKMYKALIYSSLEVFMENLIGETITLCDWGCDQGIASMLVLDYIKEKQLNIKVSDVILIDDDTKLLSRAIAQIEALAQEKIRFTTIKSDDETISDRIKSINKILNLFANDKMPIDYLEIDYDIFHGSYFLCVSNENREFVDEVYENFKDFIDVQYVSIRDGNIGRFDKYERIFFVQSSNDDPWDIPF